MCALGEVYDSSRSQCNIEYLPYDSFNAMLVSRAYSSTNLRLHACGKRLQALAIHAPGLQYTLIRSDAALASSVDAVMLQRLSRSLLRTSMLQKRVHWCVQEQSLGPTVIRRNMLSARVPKLVDKSALQAMAELSVRGCPSVAHVAVGMRGDGYTAVLQYRPLPTAEQARRVHEALQLSFDESAYTKALSILARNESHDPSQLERYAQEFVNWHLRSTEGVSIQPVISADKIVVGAGDALYAYAHHTPHTDFHVLLQALNTVCVFSVAAGGYTHTWDVGLVESLRSSNRNGGMHRARRQDLDIQMRFDPPTSNELVYATSPNVLSIVDDQVHDCVHTVRHFYPNAYEAFVFQTLVPSTLHVRIRTLFARLQHEMQAVLQYSTIETLFRQNTGPVRALVQRATLHLVGDSSPSIPITTSTSAPYNTVASMLEQAQRATIDRLQRVYNQNDPCSMAPLFGGVTTNAYFLYPFGCIVVGSGVLLRPFADESYSDTALLMGIGFVMAHELGHALLAATVDQRMQSQLFAAYPTSTYEEAIADLLGALAVMRIHGSREDMCIRLQQVWCVYVDEHAVLDPNPSHPYPHKRWEDLCAILDREF